MKPKTIEEWKEYIGSLKPMQLVAKSEAANTLSFVRQMQDEDYSPKDIEEILYSFADRLNKIGLEVPSHGDGMYTSYAELLERKK